MILRVNTVASEFRKVSNKQMAETTKRAIRENVMINSQLSKMSDKTVDLITENDDIKLKSKMQKQQVGVLEDNEKELIRKNAANQKVCITLCSKWTMLVFLQARIASIFSFIDSKIFVKTFLK